tara:strand:- start:33474 stop:34373 length:900 start_codon:yes stop_codon:yes gene_type:complete
MGLLDGLNQQTYYTGNTGGDYQFITLEHIINAFMVTYVGESKIINKVNRTDVQFHAMRAIQELSYDVFKSIKSQEIEVPPSLKMILPHDYVNYVKLTTIDSNGIELNIYPTNKTSNPFAIEQKPDGSGLYGYEDTNLDGEFDTLSEQDPSNTWTDYQSYTNSQNVTSSSDSSDIELDYKGRRYGLDPQHAHQHGSYYIDNLRGFIHFSSVLRGKTIILKYISDGLGTDAEMVVHKFCEEAIYKWIAYGVLSTRANVPEYIIARFKKEKFAETRKAKIRLSNIKIEEFTQVLKGMSKQIK